MAWYLLILPFGVALGIFYVLYKVYYVLPYLAIKPYRMKGADLEKRFGTAKVEEVYGLNPEQISFVSRDGVELKGWLIRTPNALGTMIVLHGIASCKEMVAPRVAKYARYGYNVIAYDSRANGASGGDFCTLGYYEKYDVVDCLTEAENRFGLPGPFAIHGSSMGGAVALLALEIEPRLQCGVIVCAFASLRETIADYMKRLYAVPWNRFMRIILERSERIANFSVDEVAPERAARKVTQPVLIVHGDTDERINVEYGRRNYQNLASRDKRLLVVEGAGHLNVSEVGGELLDEQVHGWINTHIHRGQP